MKHKIIPHKFEANRSLYFPSVKTNDFGNLFMATKIPITIPAPTLKWNDQLDDFNFQKIKTGASPITIVPLIVVAERISGLAKIGRVPRIVKRIIINLPFLIDAIFFLPRSITINLEKDENAESSVEAAEVIRLMLKQQGS